MDTGGSEVTTEPTLTNLYVYEEKSYNSELNERYWVTNVYLHDNLRHGQRQYTVQIYNNKLLQG